MRSGLLTSVAIVGAFCLAWMPPPQDAGARGPAPRPGGTTPAPTAAGQAAPTAKPAAAPAPAPAPAAKPAGAAAQKPPASDATPGAKAPGPNAAPKTADAAAAAAELQTYYFAILRHGPKWVADGQPGSMALAKQHQAHVAQLANLGVCVLAGACGAEGQADDPVVALVLLSAPTLDKAARYINQDPAIVAGHLRVDLVPWSGPKGLTLRPPAGEAAPVVAGAPGAAKPAGGVPAATAPGPAASPRSGGAPAKPSGGDAPTTGKPKPAGAPESQPKGAGASAQGSPKPAAPKD